MNTKRCFKISSVSWLVVLCWSQFALAYGGTTHQRVVDEAWETMRAVAAPSLPDQIRGHGMSGGSIADLTFDKPPAICQLSANDPQNLCRETVTQASWDQFISATKVALQKYYWQPPNLPRGTAGDSSCGAFSNADVLGNFQLPPDANALQKAGNGCLTLPSWKRGVFLDFKTEDDGTGYQGLLLGWQAASRDYDFAELSIDIMPVYGTLIGTISDASELGIGVILLPFVCIWDFFSGGDCWHDSMRVADSVNPIDVIKGILPGIKNKDASAETGLFHFINPQAGLDNEYDDIQGMLYTQAGPDQHVGTIDEAIIVGGDLLAMNIDASNSDGTERYELIDNEVSTNKSSDRGDWNWQSEWLGHVAMTPLDNLAYYGDANFPRGGHPGYAYVSGIYKYGWTLHALGDATVPMHSAGTTSWGHRPYEDYIDIHIDDLLFVSSDPTANTAPQPYSIEVSQLQQAQRVAAYAYRWFRTGVQDVRAMTTTVAMETLAALSGTGSYKGGFGLTQTGTGSIWCDACSYGYLIYNPKTSLEEDEVAWAVASFNSADNYAMRNSVDYYKDYRGVIQKNLERAAGASMGYLIGRASEARCKLRGEACGPVQGNSCCGSNATCGASHTCEESQPFTLLPNGSVCQGNADCMSGSCFAAACQSSAQCPSSSSCTAGKCDVGLCVAPGGCTKNSDCQYGSCVSGACGLGRFGANCRTAADCGGGLTCPQGTCYSPYPPVIIN